MIKYAHIIDMLKRLFNHDNWRGHRLSQIGGICWLFTAIVGYTLLSWLGAIVTYLIFYKNEA